MPDAPFVLDEVTVARLHAAYLSGATTARDVVTEYLRRIAELDQRGPLLNSLITVSPHALDRADELDAELAATGALSGRLHGIPVIVKDNVATADLPTSWGVGQFKAFVPERDAFAVARLREAGAIVLAKASLSEMALGLEDNINSVLPGFTRNPYNTAYACGGSSGGTAVAVAANLCAVGVGTDTGGSVRAPASATNTVGIRPTVGLVSRAGVGPLDSQRDAVGPICRTVQDAALVLEVMAGPDEDDSRTLDRADGALGKVLSDALEGKRIGPLWQGFGLRDGADDRVVALFSQALDDLRDAGADIVSEFTVPGFERFPWGPQPTVATRADWEAFFAAQGPRFPVQTVGEMLAGSPPVHPLHVERIAEFAATTQMPDEDPETIRARQEEQMYRDAFVAAMDAHEVDAIALPVWTHPPVLNGDRGQSPTGPLTFIASITQWPAVAVPMGFVGEGLPIGLQLLGRPWTEPDLIAIAYAYEQATRHRRPPTLP